MFKWVIKNIFFDFDGVILDSVDCKTQAFEAMYTQYGQEIANQVKKYHLENGGVSRFEKFRHWHKKHLGIEITNEQLNTLSEEFSNRVVDQVINSDEIKGSIDFIKNNHQEYRFWIITGTPTIEMKRIADKIEITPYFIGIHGSPEKKKHWVDHLLKTHQLHPNETLFLGDATTDFEAAQWGKLHFALREAPYNIDLFKNIQTPRFKTYEDLNNILNE